MPVPEATLREIARRVVRANHPRPAEVAEIYAEVERSVTFDANDLTPPTLRGAPVSEPNWKRNTRNALQSDKNNLFLVNTEAGRWRLPTPLPTSIAIDVEGETEGAFNQARELRASGLPIVMVPVGTYILAVESNGIVLGREGAKAAALERREITRGLEMLNLAGGRLGKGTILKNGIKEAAFVALQRNLRWSEDYRWIEIEGVTAGAHLETDEVEAAAENVEKLGEFTLSTGNDARERVARSIAVRRGQPRFRRLLLAAYGSKCCITQCDAAEALEAAHILPYRGAATDHVQNGLLVRADIHTLFDIGLLAITPDLKVVLSKTLRGTAYAGLDGVALAVPKDPSSAPSKEALLVRFAQFQG